MTFIAGEVHAHDGAARFSEHADGTMHNRGELVAFETRIGATSWVRRDIGDTVIQTRRLEPPRTSSSNDVDRRRDRRAVDVRRLRTTNDLRRAERLPHANTQLLHDLVYLGPI